MFTLLLLSSSPVALFVPKIFLVLVVSGEENDASSSSRCRCASSRGGRGGAGRTIGRRPRLLHISMNAPQERNTANRTWPGLMRSILMLLLLSFSFFLSLSFSLSVSRTKRVFDVCFYEDSVGEIWSCCGEVFYSFRRDISYFKNNTVVVVRASTVGSSKLSLSFSLILIRSAPRPSTLPRQTAAHFSNNIPLTSTKRPR